ncbi:MAG: GNAT family N-acetyltransferase, partial [Proteobacteria bacterium]|nr:GNAT family N-acetyltransferase [Pseudomonadota bacterium]
SVQSYLIDTNVVFGLEDNHTVNPVFADFLKLASTYKADIFVHEAAKDDIARDKNTNRRGISLSKIEKFQTLDKVKGLTPEQLQESFGELSKPNDVVDATLLHALSIGAVDFLVTQDQGLHRRAKNHTPELADRVLFVADATDLLKTTYEAKDTAIKYVDDVPAHAIPLKDPIFDSLREGYPEFDDWWQEKCVRERRQCWVVYDDGSLAGLIVRKDEGHNDTDARTLANKILKICTFKVRPESRGTNLGELLLKQAFWYAQINDYDLAYVTTYADQVALISLLEYYGFNNTYIKDNGELVYEKEFSRAPLILTGSNVDYFTATRENYPRFSTQAPIQAFGIPIKEAYHDVLFPDLNQNLNLRTTTTRLQRPGNTIRKVYLSRSSSNLGDPGSLLFFYKGKSKSLPSQSITSIGILEYFKSATSTQELMQLCGGRSVYSEKELNDWNATPQNPVKVINFLLACYIEPNLNIGFLRANNIFQGHPPQSIFRISREQLTAIIRQMQLGFTLQ